MKLWKGNRKDGEYELSYEEIANKFLASKHNSPDWLNSRGLEYSLVCFISDRDGLFSVWAFDISSVLPLEPVLKILDSRKNELKYE